MGWNHDLNIYNFPVLSQNSQFLKAKINSQVTAINLDENYNSKSFIFFGHFDVRVWREAVENQFGEKKLYFLFSNGSLNSLLGLGVMFLLYSMNIQYDSF